MDLMWYPVAEHLQEYMRTYVDKDGHGFCSLMNSFVSETSAIAPDKLIYMGAKNGARLYPCIEILFDTESRNNPNNKGYGITSYWIDFYIQSNSKEPSDAYRKIYEITKMFDSSLVPWCRAVLNDLRISMSPTIDDVMSDGEISTAPKFQVRVVLSLVWRGKRNE